MNSYLPEGTDASVVGWWYPKDRVSVVNNDLMLVVKGAEKPVLAHLFINYMLDPENAKANFAWNGYQPPIAGLEPDALIAEELVPESLESALLTESDIGAGLRFLFLEPDVEELYNTPGRRSTPAPDVTTAPPLPPRETPGRHGRGRDRPGGGAPTIDREDATELQATQSGTGVWAWFAAPGTLWLLLLFVVPFYAVMAIAFGGIDPIFRSAQPEWNPLQWDFSSMNDVLGRVFGGDLGGVFVRTFWYVGITLLLCTLIGYPIAYYVARRAGRSRGLLLVLIVIPFWISYLMRMLAWSSLLELDGWVNRILVFFHILDEPRNWLAGEPSTVILGLDLRLRPVLHPAALRRRSSGSTSASWKPAATSAHRARRPSCGSRCPCRCRASWPPSVITALPMFGDYYTNGYLSGSPRTEMIGNQIEFYLRGTSQPQVGAALVLILSALLLVLMAYYLVTHQPGPTGAVAMSKRSSLVGGAHVGVHLLVADPGAHRRAVLLQRRAQPVGVAGLLVPLVLGGPGPVGVARRRPAHGATEQPAAGGPVDPDRRPPRHVAGHRPGPLARPAWPRPRAG